MKIVTTNTAMSNGGDAAILFSVVEMVRRAFPGEHEFTVVDPLPNVAKKYYPEFEFLPAAHFAVRNRLPGPLWRLAKPINRLRDLRLHFAGLLTRAGLCSPTLLLTKLERKVLQAYRKADLVISTGGTYLVDNYDISARLFELELSYMAGKAPIYFTQSLGPFKRQGYAAAVKPHFDRAPLILLRDERSKACLEALGVDAEKMHVLADSVFGMADPEVLATAARAPTRIRRVGISVRKWDFFQGENSKGGMEHYIDGIVSTVEWLVERLGCEVTFLSTCQGIPEYAAKDSEVAEKIASRLSPSYAGKVRVDRDFHSPDTLQKMISGFDLVVATRMHMAILALTAGVPVLPIAYEFKTAELFNRLGMAKWVVPIEDVRGAHLTEVLEDFLRSLPATRSSLFAAVEQERQLALSAEDLLKGLPAQATASAT
jgi:colanic acid/amylovoran biosynthesis protein